MSPRAKAYVLAILVVCVLALALLPRPLRGVDTPKKLIMGLHPNMSVKTVVTIYQPLQEYLEKELGRELGLSSAPDLKSYFKRLVQRDFDLAVSPPHLARVAQLNANLIPVAYFANQLSGVMIVAKTSQLQEIRQLRGLNVALTPPYSFTNIAGRKLLRDHGLQPGFDVMISEIELHDQAAVAVDRGTVHAAIIGSLAFQQLPKALNERLRIIGVTESAPSLFFLANPDLSEQDLRQLKSALLKFPSTAEGRAFLKDNGFEGLLPATEAALAKLDAYAKQLSKLIEIPK